MSKESRFVGYLVLGFGLLAVVAVLILAFGGNSKAPVEKAQTAKSATAEDLRGDFTTNAPVAAATKTDLFFERNANLDAGQMEGDWQTTIGRYTVVLQVRKGVYQLIFASPDPVAPRLYSTGTFKVVEDIIMLAPRMDWPAPVVPAGKNIAYNHLTRAPFPVIARFDGGKMLWQNVPQSEKRVVAPYTSPLFMSENVKLATWQKLK